MSHDPMMAFTAALMAEMERCRKAGVLLDVMRRPRADVVAACIQLVQEEQPAIWQAMSDEVWTVLRAKLAA